ncbi:MAG: hypothetical protein ACFFCS_04165 [Candidatus Hodarchaeota archaeon]
MRHKLGNLLVSFKNPRVEFRPQYFWFLNHSLEIGEMKTQLDLMKKAGAGGAFLHARGGRITPYMSEEWLSACSETIKHGSKIGLKVWLYDEDGFPSGYAGGKTIESNPTEYSANFIVLSDEYEVEPGEDLRIHVKHEHATSEFFGAVAVAVKETDLGYELDSFPEEAIDLKDHFKDGVIEWKAPGRGEMWLVLVFLRECNPHAANVLSKDAMKVFVEETHDKYLESLKSLGIEEELGNTIPGIFTDEPGVMYCLGNKGWRRIIPYAKEMDEKYLERYKIPFLMGLPSVFFDLVGSDPAHRLDYWELAGDLYQEAFFKTSYDWCEKHRIAFMGHVANEGNLFNQVRDQVDFFKGARYMHYGCSDQLGSIYRADFEKRYTLSNCDNMVAPRLAHSAARIYDLPRVNSECFGSAGWELSLEAQKRLIDWQISQGINLFIPHDYSFSIEGQRKRDHPPAFDACSYFEELNVLNDYIGRLCYLFSFKEFSDFPRIGFLYGNTTILASMNPMKTTAAHYVHEAQPYIVDLLQRLHYDFDIIPEEYLAGLKCQDSMLSDGRNSYDVILLPSLETIKHETMVKLLEFSKNGGLVLFLQKVPKYLYKNDSNSAIVKEILDRFNIKPDDVDASLNSQELIPGTQQLVTYDCENGGNLAFLQAPKSPVHENHLMDDLDKVLANVKEREIGVSRSSQEIGDIVARRLNLGDEHNSAFLFLSNVSDITYEGTSIFVKGNKEEDHLWEEPTMIYLDALKGESFRLSKDCWELDGAGNITIKWDFHPSDSLVLMVTDEKVDLHTYSPAPRRAVDGLIELKDWEITLASMNILNLDKWWVNLSIEKMGIERPSYLDCSIKNIFKIQIEEMFESLQVIIDGITTHVPRMLYLKINGKKITSFKPGKVLDHKMLETGNLAKHLKEGENILEVVIHGHLGSKLNPLTEPVRLFGDFAARRGENGDYILKRLKLPVKSNLVDLSWIGFPNYTFPIDYKTVFEVNEPLASSILKLPRLNAPLFKVWMDSIEIGHVWFGKYELVLPPLERGMHELKIRYYPYPTNLYESTGTALGITKAVQIIVNIDEK